jgi:purine catabolism regulator
MSAGELQGAVVMLGEGAPEAELYLRSAAVASLTGVAMLNARDDASRNSGERLIEELVAGSEIQPGEVIRRARAQGCNLGEGLVALCVNPGETPADRVLATVAAERPDALAEACRGRIYVLLPGSSEGARQLSSRLGEGVRVAHSSHYREGADAQTALEEAEILLKMVESSRRSSSDRPTWDSIRLLFRAFVADTDEISGFSERIVGPLIDHDEDNGSELQATFWAYQESNCNMNVAARAIYAHRHTVSNRLNRIEELTGLDPSRSYDRELLSLALKIHNVIALARPR